MKKILTLALAIGCGAAMAQKSDNVGIGTTKPDPSALLDLNSNSKGFLLPRMSEAQRNAIKSPAIGLMIFQTDQTIGTYTYDGTTWQPSNARTAATQVAGAWDKRGNAIDAGDFLGSTNNFPLNFKANNLQVGYLGTDNDYNVSFGVQSSLANTTGKFNVAIGGLASQSNTTGSRNVAIGHAALMGNNQDEIIAIGASALNKNTGVANLAVGANALTNNTIGVENTAIGANSLRQNVSGKFNAAFGSASLFTNQNGDYNSAFGQSALRLNISGNENLALGVQALFNNISGSNNTAIGVNSLYGNTVGASNTAIGSAAGFNSTGSNNVLIGFKAGYNETASNKLYIANNDTATPLIGGNFANASNGQRGTIQFHLGSADATATAGFVAIGDFATATGSTPGAGGINTLTNFTAGSKYRLIVQDGILTEKLKVALRNGAEWADYVFAPEYKLMSLEDVEKYTKINKHLPNVPSADEMATKGLDISEVSKMFMEKIEELTLHVIELNKKINKLENEKEYLPRKRR